MLAPRMSDALYRALCEGLEVNPDPRQRAATMGAYRELRRLPDLYEVIDCIEFAYINLHMQQFIPFLHRFARELDTIASGETYDYYQDRRP